nr:hypothetical protein CTI12_AA234130 [Tanacetum cinerariifolium]
MLSPIITSNYIQESHMLDVVSGPGDLEAPSCFNGRSRGLQRDIHAKKKGLQPQGVASVLDNCSSLSNYVLGRKARKPKAMIYTCFLPEVDVEKQALMQGNEGPTSLIDRCLPSRDSCVYGPKENHSNPSSGQHAILYDISWELKVAVPFPQASSSLNLKEEGVFANSVAMLYRSLSRDSPSSMSEPFRKWLGMGAPLPAQIQPGFINHVPFPTVGTCLGVSLALREKALRRKKVFLFPSWVIGASTEEEIVMHLAQQA